MSYTFEDITNPFWAENRGFMTGRDPLGIQNSSVTVYGRLLPGLTNLTERIRYYSFYCWLLKEYDNLDIESGKKTHAHQYNFVRRAELIIAFLMVIKHPNERSVAGSLYANSHIDEIKNKGFYDIKGGADKPGSELYWGYISGALGQYYAGSLINLELIEIVDKFFHIQDGGRKLALAFEESIPETCRKHFLSLVKSGEINHDDIEYIEPFSLNNIPFAGSEWYFLKNMLLENDGVNLRTRDGAVTTKRRESRFIYICHIKMNVLMKK